MREVIDGQMKLYEEWCTENAAPSENKNTEQICKNDANRAAARNAEAGESQHRCSSKRKCHREKRHESEHHHRRHRN